MADTPCRTMNPRNAKDLLFRAEPLGVEFGASARTRFHGVLAVSEADDADNEDAQETNSNGDFDRRPSHVLRGM
jgi:hypothetical protein